MEDIFERLTNHLLEVNDHFTYGQARAVVELLWEDIEATYAKVGKYNGQELTEKTVKTWINQHGAGMHHTVKNSKRFQSVMKDNYLSH